METSTAMDLELAENCWEPADVALSGVGPQPRFGLLNTGRVLVPIQTATSEFAI